MNTNEADCLAMRRIQTASESSAACRSVSGDGVTVELPAGAQLVHLPKVSDPRGNLTFVEEHQHIPFPLTRVYWIYDVPGGETRGGHAYHELEEVVIAISGSFDAVISDGKTTATISLNRSYQGLYIPRMTWRTLQNFSTNAVALVLASTPFSEADYIREWDAFLELAHEC